jgi:hypothetical protein
MNTIPDTLNPRRKVMKKYAILAMAAFLMSATVPVFAAQETQERETCAISANTCLNKAEILEKRIKKLNAEIKKGGTNYSPEEMKMLDQKLQDATDQLDKVEGKK